MTNLKLKTMTREELVDAIKDYKKHNHYFGLYLEDAYTENAELVFCGNEDPQSWYIYEDGEGWFKATSTKGTWVVKQYSCSQKEVIEYLWDKIENLYQ